MSFVTLITDYTMNWLLQAGVLSKTTNYPKKCPGPPPHLLTNIFWIDIVRLIKKNDEKNRILRIHLNPR